MKKHLILILALALVAGLTVGAYAEVQNVKVSGDLTVLALDRNLYVTSHKAETAMASIARVRVDADLTDNVVATVRLLNERYWGNTGQNLDGNADNDSIISLDLAYVTLKEFLYSPLTLTVGRQELHFGNDMIVGDPTTNNGANAASPFSTTIDKDLSMHKSFDAIRATLNYDPLVIDIVAAQINKLKSTATFNSSLGTYSVTPLLNQDNGQSLVGINANYTVSKMLDVEGYFWQRRIGQKIITTINKNDITNVVGGRFVAKPMDILTWQLEGAYQFGEALNTATNPTLDRRAFAIETAATLDLKHVKTIGKYVPTVTALYAYFSGNRGSGSGTKTATGWDPMYENQTFGAIANAEFNQTNSHILGGIVTMKPVNDITLKGEYYAFWWDKRFGDGAPAVSVATGEILTMTNKKFAGQEVDLTATYDYTEDVQFSILGGMLLPGSSFAKVNRNTAGEVIGSMKVTF
jgi:hypothetical protein